MGTILFLVLRLVFGYNNPGDYLALAGLVSIDSIAMLLFLILRKQK